MLTSLRRLVLGHDDVVVRAPGRLFLRCGHCARETSGWTLTASRVPRTIEAPRGSIGATRMSPAPAARGASRRLILRPLTWRF